jgi:hypothetical protein
VRNAYRCEDLKGRDHFRDLGIDGRIIILKMDIKETVSETVDWFQVAQDKIK